MPGQLLTKEKKREIDMQEYQPDTVVTDQSTPTGTGRPLQMMSISDSVVNVLTNYVGFGGRASRSEYWWFFLASFVAYFITGLIDALAFGVELTDPTPISWILQLAIFLPTLAVAVRRIHDHGKSGWYLLVPFYNLYLCIVDGEAMPNAYGPPPTNKLG
jgi:uncharacterized membrane protein YhaH (DUF805 family)